MIHLGTLDQQQLSEVLQRIENGQKTGVIVINKDNIREEIYLYQGQVVTIISARPCEPLVRRLVHADMISVNDLQKVSTNMGKMISQAQEFSQYSDTQVATMLIQLGLISQKQLATWVKQETAEALQQLLIGTGHEIYFEENVQPPADCLYLLLTASTPESALLPQTVLYDDGIVKEGHQNPVTPRPMLFKKSEPVTDSKQFVPVTPSGFAQLPGVVLTAQDRIQRTVSAILPQTFADDGLTAKVATPPRANPLFRWETLLIIAVLLIAGLAHGINMFHYPYYEDDEGTYLSQAWAVLHLGRLAYYTYWYDHAPSGWIQIALWGAITGGFHIFSSAMDSGRTFMLLLQLGSTFILYRIARTISGSITVAIIVALLFALSPYGLYYHRRILLDNIMTFWMLLSILLLLSPRLSLRYIWFSAISLAISALSKEVTFFVIPALAYLVWVRADKLHRTIAIVGWSVLVIAVISFYPFLAIMKGELFPTGTLLGGHNPHVSLIGTVLYQGSRGKDGGLFDVHSMFWYRTMIWVHDDPILVIGGSLCAILSVLLIRKHRLLGIMGLITLSLWAFIARGGVVLDFYLIPLIPMSALTLGLTLGLIAQCSKNTLKNITLKINTLNRILYPAIVVALLSVIVIIIPPPSSGIGYGASNVGSKDDPLIYWNGTQAIAQREAVSWIEDHVPLNSRIIIDMYMWPDLYSKGYEYAHYYWKLEADPAIGTGIFHNDWRNVDYIVTTPQMLLDMQDANMKIVKSLIENSSTVAAFDTGNWRIDIRKVHK